MANNDFFSKIKTEAQSLLANTVEEENLEENNQESNDVVPVAPSGDYRKIHTFLHPKTRKANDAELAMDSLSKTITLAMSEANISTIDPDIFGPIVSLTGALPKGFKLYNPDFLDQHFLVLEKSNRSAYVQQLIIDAYEKSDSETIALPYILKTSLSIQVLGNVRNVDVKYLLFSEEEILNVALPFISDFHIASDGNELFLIIDVIREE